MRQVLKVVWVSVMVFAVPVAFPSSGQSEGQNPAGPYRSVSIPHDMEGKSEAPMISGDGNYVVFVVLRDDVARSRRGGISEIYLHNMKSGETALISRAFGGGDANANSGTAVLNTDGRYIAFVSLASNLLASEDRNDYPDIFVYDRVADRMTLVSVSSDGIQGNGDSFDPWISGNGRYVVFVSNATNLVKDDGNGEMDVFLHDRKTGETTRVSRGRGRAEANGGSYSPFISTDGRYIAFESHASNIVPSDGNDLVDVFVHDQKTGKTLRVSVSSNKTEGNGHSVAPFTSGDGRFVVYQSYADNLIEKDTNGHPDIFLYDVKTGTTTRLNLAPEASEANSESYFPSVSYDGRLVAYYSVAWNLVENDTNTKSDIFIHNRTNGETERVSRAYDGSQANGGSYSPIISGNGRFVTFVSNATNLIRLDGPSGTGVFVVPLE